MSASALARILDEGLIGPVFQPLVDLYSGETLGYEALARGPEGRCSGPTCCSPPRDGRDAWPSWTVPVDGRR